MEGVEDGDVNNFVVIFVEEVGMFVIKFMLLFVVMFIFASRCWDG
jgi:hypothetical protein